MNKKPEDLKFIETCFGEIKSKNDIAGNLKRIERSLSRLFDIKFNIGITKNTTNEFFGMNIYPSTSSIDDIVESIISDESDTGTVAKIWQETKEWYLEIDSILVNDIALNANPGEMTAILLHEIGHIVYSNEVPQRINKIIRYKMTKMNYQIRQLATEQKIRKLFNIAILESCGSKNFRYINVNKERIADKFVIHYGYGEDLNNFIDKLIRTNGNKLVNRSDSDIDNETTIVVNWTVTNIRELEFRKKALRTALSVEMLKSPSIVIKRAIQDIYVSFFGDSSDKYRELLSEQYTGKSKDVVSEIIAEEALDKFVKNVLTEASKTIFDKIGKVKKVQQSDIDILRVEVDRIETADDKIYMLDKIYGLSELVTAGIDMIESGHETRVTQSKTTLIRMRDELNEMRKTVLDTKIVDKEYGVFIKYPKGYQG